MLAAGFSAGEADQLRRAMAAWKRKGGIDKYYDRIVSACSNAATTASSPKASSARSRGLVNTASPKSHATSFALLVYASAWLKCYEPEAFLCAMLNSQPMGFYTPSQLVQDAKRHSVMVLPADVSVSGWDSALECSPGDGTRLAVRPRPLPGTRYAA
ncbi:hypothetical protein ACTMU2_22145 [Cupriavidus basilensis]